MEDEQILDCEESGETSGVGRRAVDWEGDWRFGGVRALRAASVEAAGTTGWAAQP